MSTTSPFVPELLSPAGSLKNMRYAFAYGADAVYAGQPRYSLRVRNNEFNHENLQIGINEAHALGKKFYVVCNIQPHNSKLKTFIRDLKPVIDMGPDALIMSDPGLIMMVREAFPEMAIHLSVQANAVNWATVKFWSTQGVERVILSRELSLEEIEEIRQQCPETELEIFVHGALCMAYSGRCLLSGYMNKRDPNQGTCTNACRWEYKVEKAQEDASGQIVEQFDPSAAQAIEVQTERPDNTLGLGKPIDDVVLLSESHRPEEKMAAFEDEHGTYIMNSKDLRAVQHVERLTKMGVHSLKIEGRTKSFYYCARTAQVYRKAIDDAVAGRPFDDSLMGTLESLAHRGYTEGFLRRHTHDSYQNYDYGYSVSDSQQFVGEFTGKRRGDLVEVEVKNKFCVGDSLELMTPKGNIIFTLEMMENRKSQAIDDAKGNGHFVFIPMPEDLDLEYALLMRNLNAGQDTRNPTGK
ncbi:TPA: tRNA 5-hydroxyuridine modification protein YegQ [Vibrio metschnikovii]|uniref:tRNA hydroxylation protein P n=1 Tax=Vibrio metschnikovii TaxID=28172 RepID=A0A9X0R4X0_VIBME|nr:tRNA 5-hydroxyuridine modification protein YegQ [Vibrio metschnikovii]EKO3606759.1 tRNA 5-hydroxyuridine modification protein YegQ [Vibrio metschnikovii]EKO3628165.1 tRNA 5-hydroxyuridine modification protein YegQ [Vibrio metschnikovii]EKO3713657.1 tRNA 5-hydroxyuridine modification protein YegQ [Vibrio metschnikovii]EKO3791296.1 tRNA 5-hydroxyuridine modification protein YegQ [Vibrio metschnikovii]EKO3893904.1 tRNA 5-hydroxyuridine modification protein YegQ [Vibrio metschnikovii]